jgi:apolipoprotein N-acyltransferase
MRYGLRDAARVHPMNAVVHLAPQRQSVYAKERPVPGGEYLPWPQAFGPLYRQVFDEHAGRPVPAPPELTGPLFASGVSIGVSICHEQSLALLMARRARESDVLFNLSHDAWIDSAAYRQQMLSIARVRALESGKALLRATRGGHTVLVDAAGTVVPGRPADAPDLLGFELPVMQGHTPYSVAAPWLAALPFVLYAAALAGLPRGRARRVTPWSEKETAP